MISGNDVGIWLPTGYDGENLDWAYKYNYKLAPDQSGTDSSNDDSGSGISDLGPSESQNDAPVDLCPFSPEDVKAAIVPDSFRDSFSNYDAYVFTCVLYDEAFVNGGGIVAIESVRARKAP